MSVRGGVEVDSLSAPEPERVGCGSRGVQKHTHTGLEVQYDPVAGEVAGEERQQARIRTSLFPALCLRTDLVVLKRQRKRRSGEGRGGDGGGGGEKRFIKNQIILYRELRFEVLSLTPFQ